MFSEPVLARRSCDNCEKYEYDEDGALVLQWDGKVELPVLRDAHDKPPCFCCPKVPDKIRQEKQQATSKADAINLTERNYLVWKHYQGCSATMDWPKNDSGEVDPIVKRHAGIIRELETLRDHNVLGSRMDAIVTFIAAKGK